MLLSAALVGVLWKQEFWPELSPAPALIPQEMLAYLPFALLASPIIWLATGAGLRLAPTPRHPAAKSSNDPHVEPMSRRILRVMTVPLYFVAFVLFVGILQANGSASMKLLGYPAATLVGMWGARLVSGFVSPLPNISGSIAIGAAFGTLFAAVLCVFGVG